VQYHQFYLVDYQNQPHLTMPHAFVNLYIHAVFSTKHREPLITPVLKRQVYNMMVQELEKMECKIIAINGMPDHVHLLFKLKATQDISKVIKQVKGASSREIEALGMIESFQWQVGYGAFSVSKSLVEKTTQYIVNQEKHHSNMSFDEEYKRLLNLNGF